MKQYKLTCLFMILLTIGGIYFKPISAQQTNNCKVDLPELSGTYIGDCKNGYAQGKGEAKGIHRYVGQFKYGLPNGQGTYYYSDSAYHVGNFQDGIKEGKGTTYYLRAGKPDSLVKGFWSADVYRGKTYVTYTVADMPSFDRVEITPSNESGNILTIETATTTGAIRGAPFTNSSYSGTILMVNEVIALDGIYIKQLEQGNSLKYIATYQISKFPIRLRVMLSNGQSFNLQLYKAAKWKVNLFLNK
jgi:hypothetical protein